MATRLVVLEVADTDSEDILDMLIQELQKTGANLACRKLYSCPVGDPSQLGS